MANCLPTTTLSKVEGAILDSGLRDAIFSSIDSATQKRRDRCVPFFAFNETSIGSLAGKTSREKNRVVPKRRHGKTPSQIIAPTAKAGKEGS